MKAPTSTIMLSLSASIVLAGTFLPWVRSGSRERSSYLLLDLVDRLGFTGGSAPSAAIRLWPLVPVVLVGATYAAWMQRRRVAGALGIAAALYASGLAVVVRQAPTTPLTGIDVVIAGGIALLISSIVHLRRGATS